MSIYFGNNKVKPSGVGKAYYGNNLVYQEVQIEPFYIEALANGTVNFKKYNENAPAITGMEYKIDNGSWTSWTDPYTEISLTTGQKLYLKSSMNALSISSSYNYIVTTMNYNAGGNCNSLINNVKNFTSDNVYAFFGLFYMNTNLKSIDNLILPSTTLVNGCYFRMFYYCSSLKFGENTGTGNLVLDLSSFSSLPTNATNNMFTLTGGSFTGNPTAGNKYYNYD